MRVVQFGVAELVSRHEATVRDEDSHHNQYEMKSTLDFDLLCDTMQVKTYTVHDLTKRIEKLHDQTVQMVRHIGDFSKEHSGIWVYPSDADTERQYSADYAERQSRPEAHSITAYAERKNETRPRNARKSPGHNPTTQRRHQPIISAATTPLARPATTAERKNSRWAGFAGAVGSGSEFATLPSASGINPHGFVQRLRKYVVAQPP